MKFFVDSAKISEISRAVSLGLCDGVTTNPSLMAKEPGDPKKILKIISRIVKGPVNAEALSQDVSGIFKEARELRKLGRNIHIKIPVTAEGLQVVAMLSRRKIPTTVTLIFTLPQALAAAKAGANWVCPFVGRLEDENGNGVGLVKEIASTYKYYHLKTRVLAASIRSVEHILECARAGADGVTAPLKIIEEMLRHPLTEAGIERFLRDARSSIASLS